MVVIYVSLCWEGFFRSVPSLLEHKERKAEEPSFTLPPVPSRPAVHSVKHVGRCCCCFFCTTSVSDFLQSPCCCAEQCWDRLEAAACPPLLPATGLWEPVWATLLILLKRWHGSFVPERPLALNYATSSYPVRLCSHTRQTKWSHILVEKLLSTVSCRGDGECRTLTKFSRSLWIQPVCPWQSRLSHSIAKSSFWRSVYAVG